MARSIFVPDYFTIQKIENTLSLFKYIQNTKIPLTFNQLMKYDGTLAIIFIFNENEIEVPQLLSFCHYFHIKLYIINEEDIIEIKEHIKFATLIGIPTNFANLENIEKLLTQQVFQSALCKINLN